MVLESWSRISQWDEGLEDGGVVLMKMWDCGLLGVVVWVRWYFTGTAVLHAEMGLSMWCWMSNSCWLFWGGGHLVVVWCTGVVMWVLMMCTSVDKHCGLLCPLQVKGSAVFCLLLGLMLGLLLGLHLVVCGFSATEILIKYEAKSDNQAQHSQSDCVSVWYVPLLMHWNTFQWVNQTQHIGIQLETCNSAKHWGLLVSVLDCLSIKFGIWNYW